MKSVFIVVKAKVLESWGKIVKMEITGSRKQTKDTFVFTMFETITPREELENVKKKDSKNSWEEVRTTENKIILTCKPKE